MKFKSNIESQAGIEDSSGSAGTSGQILSSLGPVAGVDGVDWIDPANIVTSATDVIIECKNTSGITIAKGTPVYQTGNVGATAVIEVAVADASDEDKMAAIGLLQSDLINNAFGYVVVTGELLNITTSPIDGVTPTIGDTIYVKPGGGLTLTKPTGVNFIQNVGLVGKVSGGNAGSLTVSSIMRSNDVPTPLYIDHDNQRLGVGATSPGQKLDVDGSVNIDGTLFVNTDNNHIRLIDTDNTGNFSVGVNSNFQIRDITANTTPLTIRAGTPGNTILTTASGRVGIGLNSPGTTLHVGGFTRIDGGLQLNATNATIYQILESSLRFGTNNTERMRIDADGDVGIGTTSPDAKLHVAGDNTAAAFSTVLKVESTADEGSLQDIHIYNQYDRDIGIKFETLGGENYIWQDSNSDDALIISTGGSSRANDAALILEQDQDVIVPNGRLGVGLINPDRKLHVKDSALVVSEFEGTNVGSLIDLVNSNASQTYNGLRFTQGTTSKMAITHIADGTTKGYVQIGNGWATGSEILVVDGRTSNVGIGTTSPTHLLNLSESDSNSVQLVIDNTNTTDAGTETSEIRFRHYRSYVAGQNDAGEIIVGKEQAWDAAGDRNSYMSFGTRKGSDAVVEKMRITSVGGISFGSTGTAYGSSGQVLTSAGDASPTWETPTTGTVTGTGLANRVAFWTGASSLSGNSNLWWDNTNGHLGIGDTTPGSKLKVTSGTAETSIYTVDVNHVRNDADVSTNAVRINMDLSGADTTTADRTNSGLFIDLDSSANGDATHEHRIKGVNSDVRFSGFSDSVHSGYFLAESNYLLGKTAQLVGVFGNAVHDASSTDGGVSNMYGVYGTSSIQDLGDVDNAFGGYFSVTIGTNRGDANVGITKGVEGHIDIDKANTITYGEMMAVSGIIDNNEGTVPTLGNQYLFKGDYQGTKGDNAYGIYTEGDKHYFDGNIGIGNTNPTSRLTVQENGITTKIATVTIGDTTAGASLTLRGGSPTIYFDRTGTDLENKILMDSAGLEFKTGTLDAEGDVDFKINPNGDLQLSKGAKISNQENTDIDSAAAEVVATVAISYTAAFFDFVVKKGTNVRSGTVYACHDGTNVEFTETSTNDLGDTSDVTLSVDKTSTNLRLIATVTSDDWSVKSLIRAI